VKFCRQGGEYGHRRHPHTNARNNLNQNSFKGFRLEVYGNAVEKMCVKILNVADANTVLEISSQKHGRTYAAKIAVSCTSGQFSTLAFYL